MPLPFFGPAWPSCFRSASFSCLSWLSAWLGLGLGLGLGQDKTEAGSGGQTPLPPALPETSLPPRPSLPEAASRNDAPL